MNNVLKVKIENGNDIDVNVLDIVLGNYKGVNKQYIVYSILGSENVMISILNEDESSFSLDAIEDDQEFEYVSKLLLELNEVDLDE